MLLWAKLINRIFEDRIMKIVELIFYCQYPILMTCFGFGGSWVISNNHEWFESQSVPVLFSILIMVVLVVASLYVLNERQYKMEMINDK